MTQPSIKRNYAYSLTFQILTMITPFLTAPYVARVLGADGVGIYSYTQSVVTYFTMFAALGTANYGTREIARSRDNKHEYSKKFWEIELLSIITSTVCIVCWIIFIFFSKDYKYYYLALTPLIFANMFDISWFYTGHEKIGYTVFLNAIFKIIGVACIFLFVKDKEDLVLYIFITAIIMAIGNLSMWIYLPKMLERVDFKTLRLKKHFEETLIYFIPTIASSIYTVLDKTLIGLLTKNTYENGYYEQATKIINMAKTAVFVAVNSVMTSRMSYLFSENRTNEVKEKISKSIEFILFLGVGCTFGICGIAKIFVPIFFGAGYDKVVVLLYYMSPLIVIIGISNCLGTQYYTPVGKTKIASFYMIAGSVANLISNMLLIPKLGSVGAVIGSLVAEILITLLFVVNDDGYLQLSFLLKIIWKKIFAGIVMFVLIFYIGKILTNSVLTLFLQVLLGIFIYCLILLIFKDSSVRYAIEFVKSKFERNKTK